MTIGRVTKQKPAECEMCDGQIRNVFYDVKTTLGPWGNLCPLCFIRHTSGRLGAGYGQRYEQVDDSDIFVKTEG